MHLLLPYIQGGQAQKHVTHNEALRTLDTVVQLSVMARADQPGPVVEEGNRYIIGTNPLGDWAGHAGEIAHREQGVWHFVAAQTGWIAWDEAASLQVVFDGAAWNEISGGGAATSAPTFGVNASADATNRLTVSSDAVLLSHAGAGHQVKVNKAAAGDTASLLFQTNWSGRAEMGLAGTDDFEIKVSPDGSTFHSALRVDAGTGAVTLPNTIRDTGISNATGILRNAYNAPAGCSFDGSQSPNLGGSFVFSGHFPGVLEAPEAIAVDPNRAYRLTCYLRQASVAGDWSAYAQGERHAQLVGLQCYDADGLSINVSHHARFFHNGTDSLTTLTQPLAPGDTVVHVADAAGWNETQTNAQRRGLVIFEYRDASGRLYDRYSRIEEDDLFDLGDVNKTTNQITLNKPLPAHMGNPDDPSGIWPIGAKIANRTTGFHQKFAFANEVYVPATDTWYQIAHAIGGIDRSGKNIATNFAPGTASVRPVFLPNHTNRSGGYSGHPDTGAAHQVWLSGLAMDTDPAAKTEAQPDGSRTVYATSGDPVAGTVSFSALTPNITAVE